MSQYIYIDTKVFTELHLCGNDAIIYSLVAGYCKHGVDSYSCKIDELAALLNLNRKTASRSLDSLVDRGYLERLRKSHGYELKLSEQWKVIGQNVSWDKMSHETKTDITLDKNGHHDGTKTDITPLYNNIDNNIDNNNCCDGTKTDITEPRPFNPYEILSEQFVTQWRDSHGGQEYFPDFATNTTYMTALVENFRTAMSSDGYVFDADTCKTYISQWLQMAWVKCDQWHRDNWSPKLLVQHYNYYNTIIRCNGQQQQRQSNQQHGMSDEAKRRAARLAANLARISGGTDGQV